MIDVAQWLAGACIAVGLIQWAKGIFKDAPWWVWAFVLPVSSFGAAFASGTDKPIWTALGIWAVSQVGYETIIQFVQKKIKDATGEGS